MKYIFLAFVFISSNFFGQINVGPSEFNVIKPRAFKSEELKALKDSKTIFVYREKDKPQLELLKSTLMSVWDYTPLEFVSYKEFLSNTYDDSYSFFSIKGIYKVKTSSSGMIESESTYIYLALWMNKENKQINFGEVFLYPTYSTYEKATKYAKMEKVMLNFLYEEATIHNWNIVFLKNYLQFINKKLQNSEIYPLFKKENDLEGLSKLKDDTLHIIDYSLISFNQMTGDESQRLDITTLLGKYPYPYKLISLEEFAAKEANSTKPLFYLSHVKSNAMMLLGIFNSKTGEKIYSDHSIVSYNLSSKFFAKLAEEMKKIE